MYFGFKGGLYVRLCDVTDCVSPSGYFLLEPWDLKKATRSPHLGVTLTVRDPNHEVLHRASTNKRVSWYTNTWAGWLVCQFKPFKWNLTSILLTSSWWKFVLTVSFLLSRFRCPNATVNSANSPSQLTRPVSTTSASKPTPPSFPSLQERGWWDLQTQRGGK